MKLQILSILFLVSVVLAFPGEKTEKKAVEPATKSAEATDKKDKRGLLDLAQKKVPVPYSVEVKVPVENPVHVIKP
ncbi:hypothetical protein CBL_01546 [Carabus blaptoides fortunei]